MNQYPAWKYLLILIVLLVGLLYALPNMFGEDPALQVTSARGFAIPQTLESTIDETLVSEQIAMKDKEQIGNRLLYRFNSTADQIRAADELKEALKQRDLARSDLWYWRGATIGLVLSTGVTFVYLVTR